MAKTETEVIEAEPIGTDIIRLDAAGLVSATERAQIDIQIATAKAYPRDVMKFKRELTMLACTDKEVAEGVFYRLPRKKNGRNTFIEGPSVRFAELVQYAWGNIRSEARVVAIDETHITAQGTCLDLEKNIGSRIEVKRRITDSRGNRYNEDMIVVTGNAACSIALRNAIFDVIPFALAKGAYAAALKMATGGDAPIEARRTHAVNFFAKLGVTEDRLLAALNITSIDAIGDDELVTLVGIRNAIQDGDTTTEEAFPRTGQNGARAAELDAEIEKAAKAEAPARKKAKKDEPEPDDAALDEAAAAATGADPFEREKADQDSDLPW